MPFAVLQTNDDPVTSEQLVTAFESIDRLTRADAKMLARHAFGFIASELDQGDAEVLCRALNRQGIAARAIDQQDLFQLPGAKKTKRIDCLPEHMLVADALGRQNPVEWDSVLIIAAGQVTFTDFQREERAAWSTGTGPGDDSAVMIESHTREVDRDRLLLDLIVAGDPCRYQAEADSLLFHYLADRRGVNARENFLLLLEDLLNLATLAIPSQGAISLLATDEPITYPARQIYEKELQWLIWRGQQQ